jgi:hypothetical protein
METLENLSLTSWNWPKLSVRYFHLIIYNVIVKVIEICCLEAV